MNRTKIEWTDYSWNPVTGCTNGCIWCYARAMSKRFGRSFEPALHPEKLSEPLKLKTSSRIFTVSMGDLFCEGVSFDDVARVWAAIWMAPWHTYQILTKRPDRMREFLTKWYSETSGMATRQQDFYSHVWLGVSVTGPKDIWRIFELMQVPAAKRFVSLEPLLEGVSLGSLTWVSLPKSVYGDPPFDNIKADPGVHRAYLNRYGAVSVASNDGSLLGIKPDEWDWCRKLDWVIVGGLTPTPVHKQEWIDTIAAQCDAAEVPLFIKDNAGYPTKRQEYPTGGASNA